MTDKYTNLDEIHRLSDRQLAEATFLLLASLAERLTGYVPFVVGDGYGGMPDIIHGANGPVVWLKPSVSALKCEQGG
jgi:hypothetical protein